MCCSRKKNPLPSVITAVAEVRQTMITSSRFHLVVHRRDVSDDFMSTMLAGRDLSHVPAIAHGRRYEDAARQDYVSAQHAIGNTGLRVQPCGLLVHPGYSYISASPNGQVYDPNAADPHGLLEIKCPFGAYSSDLTPQEACASDALCSSLRGRTTTLKKSHQYYFQVQGQLGVSGVAWCDFVLWTGPR